jgi:hypothetical protein
MGAYSGRLGRPAVAAKAGWGRDPSGPDRLLEDKDCLAAKKAPGAAGAELEPVALGRLVDRCQLTESEVQPDQSRT